MFHNHSLASAQATSDEDLGAAIASFLSQITDYKKEYDDLDKQSTDIGDKFAELFPVYNDLYTTAANDFNRAATDLDRLKRAQEAWQVDDQEEEPVRGQRHTRDYSNADVNNATRNDLSGKGSDAPISVNKLYRRIAQLAHPDKTDDPKLHELFLQAKEAKKTKSLSELISILASITGEVVIDDETIVSEEYRRAEQLSRVAALRRELEMVQMRYNQLRSSPMAKIVELTAAGTVMAQAKAETLYKTTILDRAKQMEMKTSSLKQDLAFRESIAQNSAVS